MSDVSKFFQIWTSRRGEFYADSPSSSQNFGKINTHVFSQILQFAVNQLAEKFLKNVFWEFIAPKFSFCPSLK